MKLTNAINYIKTPAFIAGFLFLIVNLHVSYQFYHANSYKILVVLLGISCLFLIQIFVFRPIFDKLFFYHFGLILLPFMATIPGILIYQGKYNYNFQYEFVINIVLILWVVYLLLGIRIEKDLNILLQLIGFTIIYVFMRGILEKFGWDPTLGDSPVGRIKVTFGNVNYLAGFITVLIPVFFALSIPIGSEKGKTWLKDNSFSIIIFFCGLIILFLTKTRAAWASSLISIIFIIIVTFLVFYPKYRKLLTILLLSDVILGFGILLFLYLNHEQSVFISDLTTTLRLKSIFTGEAFWGRLSSWEAAYTSILSSPIIGFGLGSSYNLYFLFKNPESRLFWGEQSYNHVHSEILEFTQEAGIVGIVILGFFWIVIFRQLYIILIKSEKIFYRKLALGVAGGLIAYGIQSLFSVAPRMMVTKLPVYTLIAVCFCLYIIHLKEAGNFKLKSDRFKIIHLSVNTLFIALTIISLVIFVPWVQRQNVLTNYMSSGQSLLMVEKFEKTADSWLYPDIYALFFLANAQKGYGRIQQFGKTIDKISEIIPHYRQVDYWKAIKAYRSRDIDQAIQLLKDHQQLDRYYTPTIDMLIRLALLKNNQALFFKQLQLLTRIYLANYNIFPKNVISQVLVQQQPIKTMIAIEKSQVKNSFLWQSTFIKELFELSTSSLRKKKKNRKEIELFTQEIFRGFSTHPFFKIKIRENYQKEQKAIYQNLTLYFNLELRIKSISQLMEKKYQEQLKKVKSKTQAQDIRAQYLTQKLKVLEPYNKKMADLTSELIPKTQWKQYLQKREFVITVTKSLRQIAFNLGRI
jgi:O-antigen ligase